MTPEEIRIAIAEACGWRSIRVEIDNSGRMPMGVKPAYPNYPNPATYPLPDYLNDLNACHEMEKLLKDNPDQRGWESYILILDEQLSSGDKIHATAAQRAEAFLRTVGKWSGGVRESSPQLNLERNSSGL